MKWLISFKQYKVSVAFFRRLKILFLFISISFILVHFTLVYGFEITPDLSFLGLGITFISLTIASHAVVIAIESDEKMKSIATGDFFDLANRFWDEDRAPQLYKEENEKVRDTLSWQLGNLFRHADKLKKWAEADTQERLIKEFKTFLERLRKKPCKKYWVEIKNYISISKIALDLNSGNEKIKDELIDELTNWLGKKKEEESNREYLDRKEREFVDKKKYDIFTIARRKK